jgi:hypothetical protein
MTSAGRIARVGISGKGAGPAFVGPSSGQAASEQHGVQLLEGFRVAQTSLAAVLGDIGKAAHEVPGHLVHTLPSGQT